MTPYQVGFLTSRIVAVFLAVVASQYAAMLPTQLSMQENLRPDAGRLIGMAFVLFPFVFNTVVGAFLWFRAKNAASAFVPEETSDAAAATTGDLYRTLIKVLGLYLIVMAVPDIANWMVSLSIPEAERDYATRMFYGSTGLEFWLGPVLRLVLGILLFVGIDRIKQFFRNTDRWMKLEDSGPDGNPGL